MARSNHPWNDFFLLIFLIQHAHISPKYYINLCSKLLKLKKQAITIYIYMFTVCTLSVRKIKPVKVHTKQFNFYSRQAYSSQILSICQSQPNLQNNYEYWDGNSVYKAQLLATFSSHSNKESDIWNVERAIWCHILWLVNLKMIFLLGFALSPWEKWWNCIFVLVHKHF